MSDLKRRSFSKWLAAVLDFSTRTARSEEETGVMREGKKSAGGGIATLVSVVAMVFSAYSFYETALKQANLKSYTPPAIHMFRENYRDVLAIPITISNDGAQRGTVLSFNLKVTNLETNETKEFQNLYMGNNPKSQTKRLFSPITVAGRSSVTKIVLFHATKTGSYVKTTGGVKLPLRLTLSMNTDGANAVFGSSKTKPITFDMTANYINSFPNMERGFPTALYDKRWNAANAKAKN